VDPTHSHAHLFSPHLFSASVARRAAFAAEDFAKWEKEISAFEQQDRENPPPKNAIVFVGSSSIRLWSTLAEDFPWHRVIVVASAARRLQTACISRIAS
jgi:hypothetical protein